MKKDKHVFNHEPTQFVERLVKKRDKCTHLGNKTDQQLTSKNVHKNMASDFTTIERNFR